MSLCRRNLALSKLQKVKAPVPSEGLKATNQTTRCLIPEDCNVNHTLVFRFMVLAFGVWLSDGRISSIYYILIGARGGVVGRSRVRFPMGVIEIFY
jgi:hypothetical protein